MMRRSITAGKPYLEVTTSNVVYHFQFAPYALKRAWQVEG
jgi:hypothetical protein